MFKSHLAVVLATLTFAQTGFCESIISGDTPALPKIPSTICALLTTLQRTEIRKITRRQFRAPSTQLNQLAEESSNYRVGIS